MTPEEIQQHMVDNTFFTALMREVSISAVQSGENQIELQFLFPDWYYENISKESRDKIEAIIRDKAPSAYYSSKEAA